MRPTYFNETTGVSFVPSNAHDTVAVKLNATTKAMVPKFLIFVFIILHFLVKNGFNKSVIWSNHRDKIWKQNIFETG
jgi:hypothetical protein